MWFFTKSGSKFKFPEDLISAFTSSISSISDGMAAAIIAGVNPLNGIYSTFAGPLLSSWTTSSVFMHVTTTGALALAAEGVIHHVKPEEKLTYIILITFLAGCIQLAMGVCKLGWLINLVSNSVMRGFITAISLLIILGQTPEFFGNYSSKENNKLLKTIAILSTPEFFNWYTVVATICTILCIVLLKKTKLKHLAFLLALLLGTIVINTLPDLDIKLVGDENKIIKGFPPLAFPHFEHFWKVILSAISIAIVGFLQGAGVSHLKPNPNGKYPDESGDLRGQGLANISCSFVSGIPVGGSMSQTSIIIDSGARSRWANLLSGLILLAILLLFGNLIEKFPYPCFAALLIIAAVESINKEEIFTILETSIHSTLTMLLAFALTMTLPLHFAVFACIALTAFLHIIHKPNHVHIKSLLKKEDGFVEEKAPEKLKSNETFMLIPYGSLVFSGAYEFQNKLPEIKDVTSATVIIALRGKKELGSSFLSVLHTYAQKLEKSHNKLIIMGISDNVFLQLRHTNLIKIIGENNILKVSESIDRPKHQHYLEEEKRVFLEYSKNTKK